jgi:hypothetical protein
MSRFYIKHIEASGDKVEFSQITLKDGVNIIHGASNGGKSYVIGCINFMFAGDIPFSKEATGYDTITMRMESDDGYSISMKRKIVDGKNGDTGAGAVDVISNVPWIESKDYSISKKEYSDLLLSLLGIKEHHQIISTQEYKQQSLTIRTIFHFFYIDEDNIFGKNTTFDAPRYKKITASLTALLFLFKNDDLNKLVPNESKEDRERKAAQKAGVIIYLNRKIQELTERRSRVEQSIAEIDDIDVSAKLDSLLFEIETVEHQIVEASAESRQLLERIYAISSKLEEAKFLRDRYKALQSQYASDIKRLKFIADGESKSLSLTKAVKCPFCEGDIPESQLQRESYIDASNAELARINLQIEDLRGVESDVNREISSMETQIKALNQRNDEVMILLNKQLRPLSGELKATVESYKQILTFRQEMYAIETMSAELNTDALGKELEDESEANKFDAKKAFDSDIWKELSDSFRDTVKSCAYPNQPEARISIDTVDAVVGGKHKKDEGKGYRAFLNTIMVFNLMKCLESKAAYAPRMLILDSPILSLKEKKIEISAAEMATPSMRESLFRYMIHHCGENQVIIAENDLPDNVDYSSVNLIEFTLQKNRGRYGFLNSVRNANS